MEWTMSNDNIDWKRCIEIPLDIDTVGALGQFMPARESGIIVPTETPLELGTCVRVALSLGMPPKRVTLFGYVDEIRPNDHVRLQLDRRSWKRLFVSVCRSPWRRREDFRAPSDKRGRRALAEDAFFFLPRTGQRFEANILEV